MPFDCENNLHIDLLSSLQISAVDSYIILCDVQKVMPLPNRWNWFIQAATIFQLSCFKTSTRTGNLCLPLSDLSDDAVLGAPAVRPTLDNSKTSTVLQAAIIHLRETHLVHLISPYFSTFTSAMHLNHLIHLLPLTLSKPTLATLPPLHFPLSRRSGPFPTPDTASLPDLLAQIHQIHTRYTATTRAFTRNQVVRKPKRQHGTQANTVLLGDVGRDGNWHATIGLGQPRQDVHMDLDMLTADWWVFSTSSGTGSFFLDFNSESYGLYFRLPFFLFMLIGGFS